MSQPPAPPTGPESSRDEPRPRPSYGHPGPSPTDEPPRPSDAQPADEGSHPSSHDQPDQPGQHGQPDQPGQYGQPGQPPYGQPGRPVYGQPEPAPSERPGGAGPGDEAAQGERSSWPGAHEYGRAQGGEPGHQSYAPQPYGQPQYGQPQSGQPQYGQPQYGQPQYGQPQYGPPEYAQPSASQYGQDLGRHEHAYMQMYGEKPRTGMAIASLVLGILAGIVFWLPIGSYAAVIMSALALVFGFVGVRRTIGRGMAVAGLILGGLALIGSVLFSIFYTGFLVDLARVDQECADLDPNRGLEYEQCLTERTEELFPFQ